MCLAVSTTSKIRSIRGDGASCRSFGLRLRSTTVLAEVLCLTTKIVVPWEIQNKSHCMSAAQGCKSGSMKKSEIIQWLFLIIGINHIMWNFKIIEGKKPEFWKLPSLSASYSLLKRTPTHRPLGQSCHNTLSIVILQLCLFNYYPSHPC